MIVKAYLAACYRGRLGESAQPDEIEANIQIAKEVGYAIQSAFPNSMELFVPHLNQDLLHYLWRSGHVNSDQILEACCAKVKECELLIVLLPISEGMQMEINAFRESGGMEIVYIEEWNDAAREQIAHAIGQIALC